MAGQQAGEPGPLREKAILRARLWLRGRAEKVNDTRLGLTSAAMWCILTKLRSVAEVRFLMPTFSGPLRHPAHLVLT